MSETFDRAYFGMPIPATKAGKMKAPFQFTVSVPPDQFARIHEQLTHNNASTDPGNPNAGTLDESDVSLNWSYAPLESTLTIDVTAVHSFKARLASTSQVQEKLTALITAS